MKISKIMMILMIIFITMLNINSIVYASKTSPDSSGGGDTGVSGILNAGEEFIQNGKNSIDKDGGVIKSDSLIEVNSDIYNILITLGVVLAVIIGGILGIQMMWGSIEQQAKAKEMLMPYGIGCVVIFGAFGIWKLAVTVFAQL